jgi:hypothetical protein
MFNFIFSLVSDFSSCSPMEEAVAVAKGTTSEREESHSFEKTAVVGVLNKEGAQLVSSETTQPIEEADRLSHFQRFYPLSLE